MPNEAQTKPFVFKEGMYAIQRNGVKVGPLTKDARTGMIMSADKSWYPTGVRWFSTFPPDNEDLVAEHRESILKAGELYYRCRGRNERRIAKCVATHLERAILIVFRSGADNPQDFFIEETSVYNDDSFYQPYHQDKAVETPF